jgi:hypothetical protein
MNIRGGLKQTFLVTQGRELYESQKRQRTFAGLKTGYTGSSYNHRWT